MTGLTDAQVNAVVAVAARAPSLHNTQPWRFRASGDALELRADRSRRLPATDPDGRLLLLSCGTALLGARLAVEHLGRRPSCTVLPDPADPDLVARLVPGPAGEPSPEVERLLEASARRRTHRGAFDGPPPAPALLHALQEGAEREGARLVVVERPGARRAVADLVAAGERVQRSDPQVRAELEAWTPSPGSARRDGVPAWAYDRWPTASGGQGLAVRDFAAGRAQGRRPGAAHASGGAALLVLLAPYDGPRTWVAAGAALHRVLLTATAAGLAASLHGQAVELAGLRRLLADELLVGEAPQMLLQVGTARVPPGPPTPRRPVADLLEG